MPKKNLQTRPFNETILESLSNSYENGFGDLLWLITNTTITAGHDEILAAIEKKWGHIKSPHKWAKAIANLKASVASQKTTIAD